MNRIYALVWDHVRGCLVVTSELARGVRGRAGTASHAGLVANRLSCAVLAGLAAAVLLPADGAQAACRDNPTGTGYIVGADGGSQCTAIHSSYTSANNVGYVYSGGTLTFTQNDVVVRANGGTQVHALSINGNGVPSNNPNADQGRIYAENLWVYAGNGANTRALFIAAGGQMFVSGNLHVERNANGATNSGAALQLTDAGNNLLQVGGNLQVVARATNNNGSLNGIRLHGNSSLKVAGTLGVATEHLQAATDPSWQPGGSNYNPAVGTQVTAINSAGSVTLEADNLSIRTSQNLSHGWEHSTSTDAARLVVHDSASIITHGGNTRGIGLGVNGGTSSGVMSLGSDTAVAAAPGRFQMVLGPRASIEARGANSQNVLLSTAAASTSGVDLSIEQGAVLLASGASGRNVQINHAGS